jgi:uncharacterized protein (DUF433 family)
MKSRSRTAAFRCKDAPVFGSPGSRHERGHWPKCRERFISTLKDFEVPFCSVLLEAATSYPSIAMDDEILGGTPRIAGTRIPVYMVLDAVEYYGDLEGARKSYPQLSLEQVKEAMCFAGAVLEHPVDYESETSIR